MIEIEAQVRQYAGAVTADKALIPERSPDRPSSSTPGRAPFLVAAAVLVVVVAAGVGIGLRTRSSTSPAATVTAEANDLSTELEVSSLAPGSNELVTATVTITNDGASELEVPSPCHIWISVKSDPADQVQFSTGSGEVDHMMSAQFGRGVFQPVDAAEVPDITQDELLASAAGDHDAMRDKADRCLDEQPTTRIGPGESVTVTKELVIGELGFPAGRGHVVTELSDSEGPADAAIDITIPPATSDPVDLATAVTRALADPAVVAVIAARPSGPLGGVEDPQPIQRALGFAFRVTGGWQIGYADDWISFLVKVSDDGAIEKVDTSTSGG